MILIIQGFKVDFFTNPKLQEEKRDEISKKKNEILEALRKTINERGPSVYTFEETVNGAAKYTRAVEVYVFEGTAFVVRNTEPDSKDGLPGVGLLIISTDRHSMKGLRRDLLQILNGDAGTLIEMKRSRKEMDIPVGKEWKEFFGEEPNLHEFLANYSFREQKSQALINFAA